MILLADYVARFATKEAAEASADSEESETESSIGNISDDEDLKMDL